MAFDLTQKAVEKLRDLEPEPNWRSLYFETKFALKEEMMKSVKYRMLSEELKIRVAELEDFSDRMSRGGLRRCQRCGQLEGERRE